MKNWPGRPGSSRPRSSREQRVRADSLGADDPKPFALQPRSAPGGSDVTSLRALAIACTAAAAPESVVMHGTRLHERGLADRVAVRRAAP